MATLRMTSGFIKLNRLGRCVGRYENSKVCCMCHKKLITTSSHKLSTGKESDKRFVFEPPKPAHDFEYLCDTKNTDEIRANINNRKTAGDIDTLVSAWKKYHNSDEVDVHSFFQKRSEDQERFLKQIELLAADIPNRTHPNSPIGDESQNELVETGGKKREFDFKPKSVIELGERLLGLRISHLGHTTGQKTYYFTGDLALLERALIRFTINKLLKNGFELMTVPELIHPSIIEGCGFKTTGVRTQVYRLDPKKHGDVCLAGTAEMPLAGYFMHKNLPLSQLPKKVAAVSRCFRAETSTREEEKGIYRVHQFNKVEMLMLCGQENGNDSDSLLQEILQYEKDIFTELGLHYRVLNMATEELAAPAYQKYDIEAWMPEKQFWGELSSCSNCTDYQSRRLDIKYWSEKEDNLKFVHTLNGTACALPRTIMAIMENYQNEDGTVQIPAALQPYMGKTLMMAPQKPLRSKHIQLTRAYKKLLRLPEKLQN